MKILVSVINKREAIEAIKGGAHIIDVKNPKEGSLGASFPRIIRSVKEITPENTEVSAALGDLPNLPGTASLAALGAAVCGVDYVKAGLYGTKTLNEAIELMKEVCEAVKTYSSSIKVVAVGYADFSKIGSVNPLSLPKIADKVSVDCVMIDVKEKKSKELFDFLSDKQLKLFAKHAHDRGLIVALAGSLGVKDVHRVHMIGADVMGVRKFACSDEDRMRGTVERSRVSEILKRINLEK